MGTAVAAYSFNASSGTTAVDVSGNGNTGVLTNGPLWVAGKNGNGVRLDGVNDYVNLGNPAALRLTGSMTLSAWINASAFPFDDAAIISKRQSSTCRLSTRHHDRPWPAHCGVQNQRCGGQYGRTVWGDDPGGQHLVPCGGGL